MPRPIQARVWDEMTARWSSAHAKAARSYDSIEEAGYMHPCERSISSLGVALVATESPIGLHATKCSEDFPCFGKQRAAGQ